MYKLDVEVLFLSCYLMCIIVEEMERREESCRWCATFQEFIVVTSGLNCGCGGEWVHRDCWE